MKKRLVGIIFFALFLVSLSFVNALVFNGTVYDPYGLPLEGAIVNLSMIDFGNGMENDLRFYNATTTDSNGKFQINYTVNTSWIYSPAINYVNLSTNSVQYVGQTIPGFPIFEFSQIHDVNFYLTEAGIINITAINSSGNRIAFNYMVQDTKLGSEIAYSWSQNGINETLVYVPKNRNYSITIYPLMSMPINYEWTNFSSNASYVFGLSNYNFTTRTLNKQFNTTNTLARLTGYLNHSTITGWESLEIVVFTIQPGNSISISHSMPYNMSAWNNGQSDSYNLSSGFYNITIPILAESGTALLMAIGKNSTEYYAGFKNISIGDIPSQQINFSLYGLLGTLANFSVNDAGDWSNQKNITLKRQYFNLINSSNDTITSMDGFVKITLDYSSFGAMEFSFEQDLDSSEELSISFPLLNVSGFKEMNLYTQNYAPKSLSKRTASQIVQNSNISMNQFSPGDIDGRDISDSLSIALYKSNFSCDVPNPANSCLLTSSSFDSFNPLSAVIGGGSLSFRMGLLSSGIIVHYINVDMLASGPPDALFDDNTTIRTSSGFESAMRFGSNGPKIYDYVLISMPYTEGSTSTTGLNESAPVNMSIPLFYNENWQVVWNVSANGTNSNAFGGNESHYYNKRNEWGILMGNNSCTTNVSIFNATNPCYLDTANNRIWIRLPHFSGTQPSISGRVITASTSEEDDSGDSSSGGGGEGGLWIVSYPVIDANLFQAGYSKELINRARIGFKVANETHYVGVIGLNFSAGKVTLNVSSTPQIKTLIIGEEWKVDVNVDSYYDIYLKINDMKSNRVNITLKYLNEKISANINEVSNEQGLASENNQSSFEGENNNLLNENKKKIILYGLVVLAVIIIVLIIIFSITHYKKRRYYLFGV